MKKVSIKRISLRSIFLGIISLSLVPIGILSLMMIIAGGADSGFSIVYAIIIVFVAPLLYGGVGMIFGASYNWLAPKIGTFKIEIEEYEEEQTDVVQE